MVIVGVMVLVALVVLVVMLAVSKKSSRGFSGLKQVLRISSGSGCSECDRKASLASQSGPITDADIDGYASSGLSDVVRSQRAKLGYA